MCSRSAESRGSVSAFVVCMIGSLVLLTSFVWSFGAHVDRYVHVSDVAAASARLAGQNVVGIREGSPRLDVSAAQRSALALMREEGVAGGVHIDGTRVVVTVDVTSPLNLGWVRVPGFWRVHVERHAETVDGG